jgi:hypothetical protein
MGTHADLLPRYRQLRQAGLELNTRLGASLSQSVFHEGGRKLGVLDGDQLFLDTEDAIAVLTDFSIHDVRRRGVNAVEEFLRTSPPAEGSDEWVLLHALRASRFGMFAVEAVERGVGVQVRDLLRDTTAFLVDVGFGTSAKAGMVFAMRVMVADGIGMTTGAALPFGKLSKAARAELVGDLRTEFAGMDFDNLAPEEATDFAGALLRTCLADGAAADISYRGAGDEPPPSRRRPSRKKPKG